jgi:SRSO17 transposase
MLPADRTSGCLYDIPKFDIKVPDIKGFANELKGFHSQFAECFSREEPRANFYHYMSGQFSNKLERKSIEPIAISVEDGQVRSMQRFVSDVVWDEEKMLAKYRSMVNEDMGDSKGVLVFDESGFPKKGKDSAGVGRQYCGNIGKVENSQVGVFCAYSSGRGYALIGKRLFMPEAWFDDEHRKKYWRKCKIPPELSFKSKPQLAVDILREIRYENQTRFHYVVGDSVYGQSPEFVEEIEKDPSCVYFVSVSNDTKCWTELPVIVEHAYRYGGEQKTKTIVDKTEHKPISIDTIARGLNDYFWYRRTISEGTKGPIVYDFARLHIVLSKSGLPDKKVWLVIRRSIDKNPEYSYFVSNAQADTSLETFVWLSGMRWPIEQCFEESKTELGMDHYEVRKFPGWNHHMLTCMLGHFFLWHMRIRLGKKITITYSVAA